MKNLTSWINQWFEPQTIILFFTLIGVFCIGIQQNSINNELKSIASKELVSSKSPLLDVDFYKFEYDPIHKTVTRDLRFSNKGLVPLNIANYEVDYLQNKLKVPPFQQYISGTLFQGESVVAGTTIENEGSAFKDQQLIVVKAIFFSIFDSTKQFCAERKYIFDSRNNQLKTFELTTITDTECK